MKGMTYKHDGTVDVDQTMLHGPQRQRCELYRNEGAHTHRRPTGPSRWT